MLYLLAFLAFAIIVAACCFGGLWSALLTWINMLFAAMIATNLYEPISDMADESESALTYLYDFFVIWGLFLVTFAALRLVTALITKYKVKFDRVTELIGRPLAGIVLACTFISFATFTIHMAPLPPAPFGNTFQPKPESVNLLVGPDNIWHGFIQYSSRGPMSAARNGWFLPEYDAPENARDASRNCRVFDSTNIYIYKYRHRRNELSKLDSLLTPQPDY